MSSQPTEWERKLMCVMLQRLGGRIQVHRAELEAVDNSRAAVVVKNYGATFEVTPWPGGLEARLEYRSG